MKSNITFVLVLVLLLSCKDNVQPKIAYIEANTTPNNEHPGKKLMETNCYVCHSATASHENRLAPPMIAIKTRYINENTTKEAFINDLKAWIKNPNANDAKMYGAVKRFGVMAKQPFPDKTIEKIGEYIYDYDIEKPDWFEDHFKEMNKMNKK
jgi:hypothetical protein